MSNLSWQFAQVDNGLLPSSVYAQSNVFCVYIIAVQYNCYMLVCIIVHFYYICYVYN